MLDVTNSPLYWVGTISLGIIVPSAFGLFTLFYKYPEVLLRLALKYEMHKSGMVEKYVQQEDTVFCYGEKNSPSPDKPTIVFVHGFTSSKLQWLGVFKDLRMDCHMIAMDLPGHGNSSTPDVNRKLDLKFIEHTLLEFLELVGLGDKKFHLVGSSLGGATVGFFSSLHPNRVEKVTMICPAMSTPVESDFLHSLKETMKKDPSEITYSDCLLLPQDIIGLKTMFQKVMYNQEAAELHPKIYQGLLNIRLEKNEFYLRFLRETNSSENLGLLAKVAPSIKSPAQIIWGKHDELINVSGAEFLKKRLPDCRHLEILEECGHAVDVDRPGSLCKFIQRFVLEE